FIAAVETEASYGSICFDTFDFDSPGKNRSFFSIANSLRNEVKTRNVELLEEITRLGETSERLGREGRKGEGEENWEKGYKNDDDNS
ncbi:MAG: hypothetical protein AAGM67_20200, partial [Bacteroidota bacterium]